MRFGSKSLAVLGGVWLAALLQPTSAAAQPAISSVTSTSTTVTLNGARFGAHGDYGGSQSFLNAAWNDFGTAINGGNLALDGTNNAAWTYETTGGRTASKRWAKHNYYANGDDNIKRLGSLSMSLTGTTGTYWVSFWLRCGTNLIPQGKFWRIYGNGSNNIFLSIDNNTNLMSNSTVGGTTVWGTVTDPMRCVTTWQHIEVYIRDAPDDLIQVFVDGVRAFQRGSQLPGLHRDLEGSMSNERERWVSSPWLGDGHTIDFANMVDGGFYGVSDPFVDYTRARVELSDSPTWVGALHKEIQIPTRWTDTQVTVNLNKGTFATGQTVYAYVVDANGTVNATGYPVVIGGGTTTPPPSAPVSLRIIR